MGAQEGTDFTAEGRCSSRKGKRLPLGWTDGQTDLACGARSAKGGRGRGRIGLAQLVVDGES